MVSILNILRPEVDATVANLAETEFRTDPIAGRRYSLIPAIIGSAQKRHGTLIEKAILAAVDANPNYTAWQVPEFRISNDAIGIAARVNNVKKNPDWLDILEQNLAYGVSAKTVQIDLMAYNRETGFLCALEIKRGYSHHDAGKKKAILKDMLCVQMLLRSYGERQDGLNIDRAEAKICNFYKDREFADQILLDKDELDDYFGAEILGPVEEVNHYFRQQIHEMLDRRLAADEEVEE